MWDVICQQDKYRLTYKTVSSPTGWFGSVGLLDGYDASKCLGYCNTVKFIWIGDMKQMKEGFMWIYVWYYMST